MQLVDCLEAFNLMPEIVAQREAILRQVNLRPGESVLDVGCGAGYLCRAMAEIVGAAGQVRGIDIAADVITLANIKKERDWLSFEVGDAKRMPFPGATFDVVTCIQLLEYLPRFDVALSEIFRVLRPKGRALLVSTDWDSVVWNSDDDSRMESMMQTWRKHCFDPRMPRRMRQYLNTAGFKLDALDMFPIINLEFRKQTYSYHLAELIGEFALTKQHIAQDIYDEWTNDLRQLSVEHRYLFQANRFLFRAVKAA